MAKVRVLPEILAHKIAAGEVVERPASVAKELLENALDAGAGKISVEVADGGRRRICVRDDGQGMSPQDARLAFCRHATSKIAAFEDLDAISTLGFRGEALPAIASVSRLRLRTIERDSGQEHPLGTEIVYEGGELRHVREVAWPSGTEIVVEDLFFNVPARRKFLKAPGTELGHLSRQVQCYALAYPQVEFRFRHQGRSVFDAPKGASLRERVFQILGESYLENMADVEYVRDEVRVSGFVSLPHEQKGNSTGQHLYVNGRMVRDKVLTHALRQAYRDLIPSNAYPLAILFVEVDPSLIDVNVHPAKTEIRFRRSNSVHSAVYHGVEEALLRHRTGLGSLARDVPEGRIRPLQDAAGPEDQVRERVERSAQRFFSRQTASAPLFSGSSFSRSAPGHSTAAGDPQADNDRSSLAAFDREPALPDAHGDMIPETAHLSEAPIVMGQFVESFIIAADRDGVMLVDQHVAHERILYEQILEAAEDGRQAASQRLLMPITLELNPVQRAAAQEVLDELNANGFEVEWFGESTIAVKATPQAAGRCEAEKLVESVIDDMSVGSRRDGQAGQGVERLRERLAASMSCRSAIKINTALTAEKMQWLLDQLFRCRNPYTCPHGRPIVLRLSLNDVLKGFKRV